MENKDINAFLNAARFPIYIILTMWVVHITKIAMDIDITHYGVYPRTISGAKGIIFSPFIHGDFSHLISNTIPMFVLGLIVFTFYRRVAVSSFILIYILTGFLVWLLSSSMAYHIGASGVVYGLLSFVFWSGIFRQNIRAIVLALIVLVLYSGYFFGVLPDQEGVSWESHLFGAIIGIIISFIFKSVLEEEEREKESPFAHEALQAKDYFLPRDIFDKTKKQREEERQRLAEERMAIRRQIELNKLNTLRNRDIDHT